MTEVVPKASATVTLVRDVSGGIEVLMMRRNLQSGFVPGMYVFPGGALDAEDLAFRDNALCACLDDAAASSALGLACDGIAYWAAAIREAFEECGLLLAYDATGRMIEFTDAALAARFAEHRRQLNEGVLDFAALLAGEGLRLAADQLTYFSNWITPVGAPRRYDTRFFVARAPAGQEPMHDERETIDAVWMRPQEALDRHAQGKLEMRTPTVRTLEAFSAHGTVDALITALSKLRDVRAMLPRIAKDGRRVLPGEPGYEEAGTAEGAGRWQN
jgi:8-oxo-dGTP pyrophosphatase MutT (NUDIX family)